MSAAAEVVLPPAAGRGAVLLSVPALFTPTRAVARRMLEFFNDLLAADGRAIRCDPRPSHERVD